MNLIRWLADKKNIAVAGAMIIYAVVGLGWQQGDWKAAQAMIVAALVLGGYMAQRREIEKLQIALRKK